MNRTLLAGAFLLLGTLWGSSFVAIDVGLEWFPPLTYAGLRYLLAGVVVLGYALFTTADWRPTSRRGWLVVGIAGTFLIGGHHALLYIGQLSVQPAVAAVIVSLIPVLTALFGVSLLGKQLQVGDTVGFLLGFLGVFLVAQPGVTERAGADIFTRASALDPFALLAGDGVGVLTVFVAAASFAIGAVLTEPFETGLPARTIQAWAMLIGATELLIAGLLSGESIAAIQWSQTGIGALVYLGLIPGAVAFLLYFTLLGELGSAQINLISYLEPIMATVLSWLILDELIDPLTGVGFVLVLAGFVWLQRASVSALVFEHKPTTRSP